MNIYQEKIYNHLLERITTGDLKLNKRIPTENELGRMFGTNRMNAYSAIKELERYGILRRNKRQGTFVDKVPGTIKTGELKSVTTRRVCVLSHINTEFSNIHWNDRIINAFEKEINNHNIEMIFQDISNLDSRESFCECIKTVSTKGYNALIFVWDDFINSIISEHPEVLFQFHNNVFIFDRGTSPWQNWPYNVVSVNVFKEGIMAAEYLLQNNYERIIYIRDTMLPHWALERERGLQFGLLRESDKEIQAEVFEAAEKKQGSALAKLKNSSKKTAIVAQNDEAAARIYKQAIKETLVPGVDFGLLGFDDNKKFRNLNLTTISPPLERIGSRLAEMVINNINGKTNKEISTTRIDSDLIVRKTC